MSEKDIFIKENDQNGPSSQEIYETVRVVPSMFWLILLGGFLVVITIILWSCFGWTVQTTNISGIYHPNVTEFGDVICFMPLNAGKKIEEGMSFTASVAGYNQQKFGHMKGTVSYVEPYVTSVSQMRQLLGDDTVVNAFVQSGPVAAVICKLNEDDASANGYYWSSTEGGELHLQDGTYMSLSVTLAAERPIVLGLPLLSRLFN